MAKLCCAFDHFFPIGHVNVDVYVVYTDGSKILHRTSMHNFFVGSSEILHGIPFRFLTTGQDDVAVLLWDKAILFIVMPIILKMFCPKFGFFWGSISNLIQNIAKWS